MSTQGRNSTSFPAQMTARLRQLHARYLAALADGADRDHGWAGLLRYYQWVVRAVFSNPDFGLGSAAAGTSDARGLLCYHTMGLGKTRLAVAVALALRDVRPAVVMLPRSLRANFEQTIETVLAATDAGATDATGAVRAESLKRALAHFTFVSMDAFNAADQVARAGTGRRAGLRAGLRAGGRPPAPAQPRLPAAFTEAGLDGKLFIVDEAHNFFRAIINGGPDSNARRIYEIVMGAANLRILFLTGTPAAKDPFELVPCFNMLAGFNLLPTQYEVFYDLYVDRGLNSVKNREHFANRIVGLVSHVSTSRSTEPVALQDGSSVAPARAPGSVVAQALAEDLLLSDEAVDEDPVTPSADALKCDYTPSTNCLWLYPPGTPRWQELEQGATATATASASASTSTIAYSVDRGRLRIVDSAAAVEAFSAEFGCMAGGEYPAIDWARVAAAHPGVAFDPYNKAWVAPPSERAPTFWYTALDAVNYFVWDPSVVRARKLITETETETETGAASGRALAAPQLETPTTGRMRSLAARAARDSGWFPEELPVIVSRVEMGPDQYRVYLLARERENAESSSSGPGGLGSVLSAGPLSLPGAEKKGASTYHVHSRSLGNFAPPRNYEKSGADKIPLDLFTEAIGPKLALVAQRARAAPGPVLVYSQFVESGLRPLTRYLQRAGFVPWKQSAAAPEGGAATGGHEPSLYARNAAAARRLVTEGGPLAGAYTSAERALIATVSARQWPALELGAWYDPDERLQTGYSSSRTIQAAAAFNLHHGQRKLFIGELQALLALLPAGAPAAGTSTGTGTGTGTITVVYAGAAPGYHLGMLARLFPKTVWHLYDPSEFHLHGTPDVLTRIYPHCQFFTDATAREWTDRCDIFISDIRLNPPGAVDPAAAWSQEFEDQVAVDMAAQAAWTELIRPRLGASLKWRPPYVSGVGAPQPFRYLRGRVLVQTWPSRSSTEGRLIVSGADAAAGARFEVDLGHYQDSCAQRNTVVRPWARYDCGPEFNTGDGDESGRAPAPVSVPGFDCCFDCASESAAWRAYCARPDAVARDPVALMAGVTRATQQRLDKGAQKSRAECARALMTTARRAELHGKLPELPMGLRIESLLAGAAGAHLGGAGAHLGGAGAHLGALAGAAGAPPAYAVISGEVPTEDRTAIVAAFNSQANTHGAVIKAILVSKTGAEGLDLKCVRETHQLEPYWDRARDDQVRARAVRVGSHDALDAAERVVQPYIYIAVANPAVWNMMPPVAREAQSIDELFYARAESRYRLNLSFRAVLAEACLECDLFGYGARTERHPVACRACVPTGAPLWHADPATDARMPDSCELLTEHTVEARPVTVDGTVYSYAADSESPFGYTVYEERADLGAWAPVDLADKRLPKLVRAILDLEAGSGHTA